LVVLAENLRQAEVVEPSFGHWHRTGSAEKRDPFLEGQLSAVEHPASELNPARITGASISVSHPKLDGLD
jgi:hypothetical protein